MVWLKLLLTLVIILFAGTKLARYADAIAEKTGLGRVWIGLILVAAITSMPELITGVSSAALVKLPDLAMGTFLGSCLFNLSIIAILDIISRRTPILSQASKSHMASAGMGIALIALAGGVIFVGGQFAELSLGGVGISSFAILLLYLAGARQIFYYERKNKLALSKTEPFLYGHFQMKVVCIRFALSAIAVIGAGIWLSFIGDEIARTTGWDTSFVGSLFLAVTTSMPELVVTIVAVRMGAVDMAIADILGANMFDIVNIMWADLAYTQGPILAAASRAHITTAILVMIMNLLVIAGLGLRSRRKALFITSWYSPLLIGLYIFGTYALFTSA